MNVWIAMMWKRHIHSEKARTWFEQAGDERFVFCRTTQIAVLRLLTTERALGRDVQTMAGAWKLWDRVTADERISFVAEPEGIERPFRKVSQLPSASPKVWGDAYLLGFAEAAGLRLVTFDQALKSRGRDVVVL
ncbi:MAG: TA system VapC family ribonuclease toxin [Acidobacteriaceae bacterium]